MPLEIKTDFLAAKCYRAFLAYLIGSCMRLPAKAGFMVPAPHKWQAIPVRDIIWLKRIACRSIVVKPLELDTLRQHQ